MSEKTCAVCGKVLDQNEIRINERDFRPGMRRKRYLCFSCRQKEYNNYMASIKKLIEKK
jgi:transposase